MEKNAMSCTLVYVPLNQSPFQYTMAWTPGLCVADVIRMSNVQTLYPETSTLKPGIFAHYVELITAVKAGDRVELYRPLLLDPKEKRRQRVKKQGISPRGNPHDKINSQI